MQSFQTWPKATHQALHMQRGGVTFIATNTNKKCKPGKSAKTNIRCTPPTGQYYFNVQFVEDPHDVFLPQNNLSWENLDRCYIERPMNRCKSTQLGRRPQFNPQGLPMAGMEGLYQVDQVAAIANGEP